MPNFNILELELSLQPNIFGNWEPWKAYVFTQPSALVSFCPSYESLVSFHFRFILGKIFLFGLVQFIIFKSVVSSQISKVPSKVKALAWLVAHKKVNTNDML